MIITLELDANPETIIAYIKGAIQAYPSVEIKKYEFSGLTHKITEIHLIGETRPIKLEQIASLPGVQSATRVSLKYRLIGRSSTHSGDLGFVYNGVNFSDKSINIIAGVCAVDTKDHVDEMMKGLKENDIHTARMGVYKPRTNPYDFQGMGAECLPWLFEKAGKYDIKVIAIEVCKERHIEEISKALQAAGKPTGVLIQVGTRNAQNFELLKELGKQKEFPVLFKRGMSLSLEDSLNACEYIASEGNANIIFCFRGVKSYLSAPHRNLVDFSQIPTLKKLTRLPICIDPSHSIGHAKLAKDNIPEIFHATGQGILVGATNVLIEFHPHPEKALCDGHQALKLSQIPQLKEYIKTVRETYIRLTEAFTSAL